MLLLWGIINDYDYDTHHVLHALPETEGSGIECCIGHQRRFEEIKTMTMIRNSS